MTRQPLDLSPQELRELAASSAFSDWIKSASKIDLNHYILGLESLATQMNSELARRSWAEYPRTYRRAAA